MEGRILGFILWCVFSIMFLGLAAFSWFSKNPVGFWANADVCEVRDVKEYNHALSRLFGIFGIVTIVLGIPLLAGQNSAWVLLSVAGVMIESIIAMAVYTLVIEKKYKK
ncbi:MAG: hypothetical protein HFI34_08600 [Lachnospiraceae bacterium]|nr:hypothetical protein [Lachnospiraceae bacterium]